MIRRRIRNARALYQKLGAREFAYFLFRRFILKERIGPLQSAPLNETDICGFYNFIRFSPFGPDYVASAETDNVINWVIPDFGIGSGGHLNIFRLIMMLEKNGFTNRIVIAGGSQFQSAEAARACIREHFSPVEAEVSLGAENLRPAAATIATSWTTAYAVRNFRTTKHKIYFVQDYEPFFYAHGSDYSFAEATYNFGFIGITAGGWLAQKLAAEHGMVTYDMGFSYDRHLYRQIERRSPERRRVFFYARRVTQRRAFELGMLTLESVYRRLPNAEFILAGWDTIGYRLPFPHLSAGNVALEDLADLYSQCDVALVLSTTNLSLLPLELMACGCPVVSNNGPNVAWLLNDSNSIMCEPTPEALAEGVVAVLENKTLRKKLAKAGMAFAQATSWEREGQKIAGILGDIIGTTGKGSIKISTKSLT
jgi:glycosyltransferase involved in cell wall biosynthesis